MDISLTINGANIEEFTKQVADLVLQGLAARAELGATVQQAAEPKAKQSKPKTEPKQAPKDAEETVEELPVEEASNPDPEADVKGPAQNSAYDDMTDEQVFEAGKKAIGGYVMAFGDKKALQLMSEIAGEGAKFGSMSREHKIAFITAAQSEVKGA